MLLPKFPPASRFSFFRTESGCLLRSSRAWGTVSLAALTFSFGQFYSSAEAQDSPGAESILSAENSDDLPGKPRALVLPDIGDDPDDQMSLVRFGSRRPIARRT
jgi:hypothetical protein